MDRKLNERSENLNLFKKCLRERVSERVGLIDEFVFVR